MPSHLIYDDVNYVLRYRDEPTSVEEIVEYTSRMVYRDYQASEVLAVLNTFVQYGTVLKHGSWYSIATHPLAGGRFCRNTLTSRTRRSLYPWS